jgi:hypothetical protein
VITLWILWSANVTRCHENLSPQKSPRTFLFVACCQLALEIFIFGTLRLTLPCFFTFDFSFRRCFTS